MWCVCVVCMVCVWWLRVYVAIVFVLPCAPVMVLQSKSSYTFPSESKLSA